MVKLLCIIEVADATTTEAAQLVLANFREAVLPSWPGLTIYQATVDDVFNGAVCAESAAQASPAAARGPRKAAHPTSERLLTKYPRNNPTALRAAITGAFVGPVFDEASGIRERLALLAAVGPTDCLGWRYDSSRDMWHGERRHVPVKQEGAESLAIILSKWKMSRADAMQFIGYPDERGR